ncbi:hypothetical protein [Hymenobacter sp. 5516J-16]|uniref:hypothetical protein n=1 Tax=Hymenobacter sp. 5516J-16 TaxID=2932253 RepID=UPI00293E1B18|nr:hypothetical protein [Hymenobacter sp. 5516J-16]
MALKSRLVEALTRELALRQDYLGPAAELTTIYFGGGTPSLLTAAELDTIFGLFTSISGWLPMRKLPWRPTLMT